MRQFTKHLAELLSLYTRIAQIPGIDPRIQSAYQTLLTYLQQHDSLRPILLPNDANVVPIQQLEAKLSSIAVEPNAELMSLLQAVVAALEVHQENEVVGISLDDVKAQFLKVSDIASTGSGVKITRSHIDQGIEIEQVVSASDIQGKTTQSPIGPAVELSDVNVGGDLKIGSIVQTVKQFIQGTPADVRSMRQRMDMLSLIESIWIDGILRPIQQNETQLQLQFTALPELVDNQPFAELVQISNIPTLSFSKQDNVVSIAQQFRKRLLIVGEPGSGKTSQLLFFAQAAIATAREDFTQPIPVVLHLASWSPVHSSLASWLLAEMKEKYRVSTKKVELWLAEDALLLILDGLDEVNEEARLACLRAINAFLDEHSIGIVVGCRKREYLALDERLKLSMAIDIQPLTLEQISAYLTAHKLEHSPVAMLIQDNQNVCELARSPLGLHILAVAAHQGSTSNWLKDISSEQWQSQLFAAYLSTMFQRRSGQHPYSQEHTILWLRWLARQMMAQNQSIFLPEQMQPILLGNQRQRIVYELATRGIGALLFVICCPLTLITLLVLANRTTIHSLLEGLSLGLLIGTVVATALMSASILARWLHNGIATLLASGLTAIGVGLMMRYSLLDTILLALIFGLPGSLAGLFLATKHPIQPVERISWSWRRLRIGLLVGLAGSALLGLLSGLLIGMESGIQIGLMVGLCCLLPVSLFGMRKSEKILPSMIPNQGIHISLHRSLVIFVLTLIASSIVGILWEVFIVKESLIVGLAGGASLGVPIGLIAGLAAGGATSLQHYTLRAILASSGVVPWNYIQFLDYATARVFLSRVGGGYMFYHRLLLEYLANSKEPFYETKQASTD